MPPLFNGLFGMVKGPWTATRLGAAALALAAFVACALVPSVSIATVGGGSLTTTHAIGGLGLFLVGVVMNAPGSSATPAPEADKVEPPKSATG